MPWKRSLFARLLAPYLLVLAAIAFALYLYSDSIVEQLYLNSVADGLLGEARLAGELLPWDLHGPAMDLRCTALAEKIGARITVIQPDGVVVGDSEAASETLENHRDRDEVRDALRHGDGSAVRLSVSVKRPLFYRAWHQYRDGEQRIVRLAMPLATIDRARHRIRVGIWGGFVVAALAAFWPTFVVSAGLSRRLGRLAEFSQAIADGREALPLLPEGRDNVAQLERNITAMAASLRGQLHAARDEQAKLEAVLRSMVEGVVVIDRSGTIRLSNRCAEQLFGLRGNATLVRTPLIAASRDPDLHALVREVMNGEREPPLVREITIDATHLQVTVTPVLQTGSEPQLFILVFHDITTLKRLEATRRDFVANVSHELRTPLTAIRGYAETLLSGAIDDPSLARKFVGVVERHAERLGRLTDDLLILSDLELGRAALQRGAMDLAPAIAAAVDTLGEKARQAQVALRMDAMPNLPPLHADPDRVEQVLVNLIDNAVKYTHAGGQVTVSARFAAPDTSEWAAGDVSASASQWIEIRVSDTGIGIPRRELPRLTERFYRVDKARSRELGGTGLGLAIVKHIVQAHGGTLAIDSEVGRGTSVRVYLPAAELT